MNKYKYLLHGHFNSKYETIIDNMRDYAQKKFKKYLNDSDFNYGHPHVTIIYGPVLYSENIPLIEYDKQIIDTFYPGFIDKFSKKKLPNDLKFLGVTPFLSVDRITIKMEFESKKLNKMRQFLIDSNPEIKKFHEEFKQGKLNSEVITKKKFPNIFTRDKSYDKNPKGWIHATLMVIKGDVSESDIISITTDIEKELENKGIKKGDITELSEIGLDLKNKFIAFYTFGNLKHQFSINNQKGGIPIETINYKSFIDDIKYKKIIGIGENLHGANFSFYIRKKIISSLYKLNKNIIICLEETDEALKNWDTDNFFPMHKSKAFIDFYNFCVKKNIIIIGIDDYEAESRHTSMYKNIINVNKKYPKHQLVFLAFDTHVSFYFDFSKDIKSYDEREEVGYKLKQHFNDQYISIGLIVKTGKTIGKTNNDNSILVTLDFENTQKILDMNEGIYKSNNQDLFYSGAGPYYFNGYNVKFLDYFWVWDYTTPHKLIL